MVGAGPYTDVFDRHVELQGAARLAQRDPHRATSRASGDAAATPSSRARRSPPSTPTGSAPTNGSHDQIVATIQLAVRLDYESRALGFTLVPMEWWRARAPQVELGQLDGARRTGTCIAGSAVELPDQAQPLERQQVVDHVDRRGERRHEVVGEPAGRDHRRVDAELVAQPADDPVDLAGEAVDDPRADRVGGRLADQRARLAELDLPRACAARSASASSEISMPGRDDPAEVLALGGDDVVGDRRAEVDDDAGAPRSAPTRRPR